MLGLLSACGVEGDLGRPKRSAFALSLSESDWQSAEPNWTNDAPNWINDEPGEDVAAGEAPSVLSLTVEEVQLRETAYRLRVQLSDHVPIGAASDPERDYAEHLTRLGYVHGPARLAKIEHEIRTDHEALSKFAHAARRVIGADAVRIGATRDGRTALTGADRHDARNRIGENYLVVRRTFADIRRRIRAYAYAIDRTRIETPVLGVDTAMAGLAHLRDRSASLEYELTQAHESAHRIAAYAVSPKPREIIMGPDAPVDIRPPSRARPPDAPAVR